MEGSSITSDESEIDGPLIGSGELEGPLIASGEMDCPYCRKPYRQVKIILVEFLKFFVHNDQI